MLPSDLIGGVVCWSQATHLVSKAGAVEGTPGRFLVKVIPGSLLLLLDYVGAGATSYNSSSSGVNMSWLSAMRAAWSKYSSVSYLHETGDM